MEERLTFDEIQVGDKVLVTEINSNHPELSQDYKGIVKYKTNNVFTFQNNGYNRSYSRFDMNDIEGYEFRLLQRSGDNGVLSV